MTKTIHKYALAIQDNQSIEMPAGSKALCIDTQQGDPQLWVLCDPEMPKIKYNILCVGTGHEITKPIGQYLGTIQILRAVPLVFHFFSSLADAEQALPLIGEAS
ncbi:DUF7352 domain-containing protein [Acinetobacter baumannii]|uniref:DUF7352 domain-containing protein n=1 Tax=Acinetobacter baumannii TaxID=470 RepID=UPI001AE27105|nr:hypothetical protein [Acinetobacter baumannii]MBP1433998.1 hypothetical protein [Acinetobacter baumannii]